MAWPIDAVFEALVATVTTVKAATHTEIQNKIVDIIGARRSLKTLWVDGVGSVASAVANGMARIANGIIVDSGGVDVTGSSIFRSLITASGDIIATIGKIQAGNWVGSTLNTGAAATPTPVVPFGQIFKDMAPIGWARVKGADATIFWGVNIFAATRSGAGVYVIKLNNLPATTWFAVATPSVSPAGTESWSAHCDSSVNDGAGHAQVTVTIKKSTQVPTIASADADFGIVFFGA